VSDQHLTHPDARLPITPERAEVFLTTLRQTGSYHAAAAAASPHLVRRGSKHCSVQAFRNYAKRNPAFAEAVEAAMGAVRGRMEALVLERAMNPDERPIFHPKTGELLGVAKDSRPANTMLALWLSSHDPSKWAPKSQIKTDVTVTNADAGVTGGAYVVRPDDVMLLPEADRERLIGLLMQIEELRDADPDAMPEPERTRPYNNQGWASDARPAALPGPTEDADGPA
jgi:hypothetical protein